MKKSLFIILMVCLAVVGLVSCKNEIEPAQEELVSVSFENGSSRALTATLEDFDVDDFYWSYEAKKADSSGLKSGETTWDETGAGSVSVQSGKGLSKTENNVTTPVKVPGFSKGYWNFRLFAYTDANREKLAYWGEADYVLIDNIHHLASVTVNPVSTGDGFLRIGTIEFVPASGSSAPTDLVVYTDEVFELVEEQWKPVTVLPVEGVYTLPAKQYKFTRTYSFDGIPVANGSVIVMVYSNLTTTVSGSLSELTTYAQFDGKQNPDIVKETWGSEIVSKDFDPEDDTLYFTRNQDTETTKVASAKMPAAAAVAKLAELEELVGADDNSSSTLNLNLSVDTTDVKQQSVTYDIGMEAVLTYTKNQTQSVAKSDVKNVTKYVMIDINLTSDISDVITVTHSGEAMILTDNMSKAGEQGETDQKYVDVDKGTIDDPLWVGFYQLETTTNGKVLHLKTKSFSPFEVTYDMTNYVAAIGSVKYTTLTAAIGAANAGDTIIILSDITTDAGYLVEKTLSIDTNGHTITVNEGANIGNRAFKVTSGKLSVYGGGTIDAKGQATYDTGTAGTGCYGAFRAGVGTELYLKDITLKNYRPWGLNVKVLGARAELDNVKIVSVCGGGIEVSDDDGAAGNVTGYAKLTNCVIEQSGWRDWCSVPVSVSGNSKVDVYSSSYTGEYGAFVFSSGGVINIYGGAFTANDEHPVLITTYDAQYGNDAIINVSGGSFTGAFEIGTDGHQFLKITGGTFDHDPTAYVAEGYISDYNEQTEKWTVIKAGDYVATVTHGTETTGYYKLEDAFANVNNNGTVTLLKDYTLAQKLVINPEERETLVLDLGKKTLTGRLNVSNVDLTIKNGNIDAGTLSQAVNVYGTNDVQYAGGEYTVLTICEDVKITGEYGICIFSTLEDTYYPLSYGVVVNFYGESKCNAPAYVSGNIGYDNYEANRKFDLSGKLPAGITAPSKAMHKYGPVFNVYGKLVSTNLSEDGSQGLSLSGMVRVNVYDGAEINGNEGIGMKSGVLNVHGGLIQSVGQKKDPVQAVNSGTEASGAAISISSNYTFDKFDDRAPIEVNIDGGTVKGTNNGAILVAHSYKGNLPVPFKQPVALNVDGGKFICEDAASQLIFVESRIDGDDTVYPPTGFISGGLFSADPSSYVAPGYKAVLDESTGLYSIDDLAMKYAKAAGMTVLATGRETYNPDSFTEVNKFGYGYADCCRDDDPVIYRMYGDGKLYILSLQNYTGEEFTVSGVAGIRGWYNNTVTKLTIDATLEQSYKIWKNTDTIKTVVFTENVASIPAHMFNQQKGISEITIPGSVERIGYNAFAGCTELTTLLIKESSSESAIILRDSWMRGCTALTTITVNRAASFGNYTGRACPNLKTVYLNHKDMTFTGDSQVFNHTDSGQADGVVVYVLTEEVKSRLLAAAGSNDQNHNWVILVGSGS